MWNALVWICLLGINTAHATEQYRVRGKISGPEGTLRGHVTFANDSIEVEKRFLWIRDSMEYSYHDTRSIRIRRGLLCTKVRVRAVEGEYIQIRTWSWHYEPIQTLLGENIQ